MKSQKKSRRIVVNSVEYRWRATGNDGYIMIAIWPTNRIGPFIGGSLRYHETCCGDWARASTAGQIVITNRIIRRIIEHAITNFGYDPRVSGNELHLQCMDEVVDWGDAVRARRS